MAKTTIAITLDDDLVKLAKEKRINLSGTINKLLHEFLKPKLSDLPDENIKIVCGLCGKEIEEGYKCEASNLLLCQKCQDKFDMKRCLRGADRNHEHIKWTRETLKQSK